jgi:hypothetical protein
MAGVFQNIDPPPPHRPASCGGRTHSLVGERGGRSIFWKTSDTALYSMYVPKYFVAYNNKAKKLKNKLIPLTSTVLILTQGQSKSTSHFQADLLWCEGKMSKKF